MKYFIFATLFICSATVLYAQDFFIPEGALPVVRDELKPLNKGLQDRSSNYSDRRYKVIDGRVFAIENEPKAAPEPIVQEQLSDQVQEPVTPHLQPEQKVESEVAEVEPEKTILPPKVSPVDNSLPSYKNRYTLYLADLQSFQKTKKMPENADLNEALKKLSAPRKNVLFDGIVK